MWTTAATFYGLVFVDFPSLEQLGRLIGHSMVLCGVLTLVLVPASLPRKRRRARSLAMPGLAAWVQRNRTPILPRRRYRDDRSRRSPRRRLRINPTLDRLKSVTPAAVLQEQLAPMFGLPGEVYVVLDEGPDLQPLSDDERAAGWRAGADATRTSPLQAATVLLPSEATQAQAGGHRAAARGISVTAVNASLSRGRGSRRVPARVVRSVPPARCRDCSTPPALDLGGLQSARARRPRRPFRREDDRTAGASRPTCSRRPPRKSTRYRRSRGRSIPQRR